MNLDKAVQLAIGNIKKEGLNDIFPHPKELELLKFDDFTKHIAEKVTKQINSNSVVGLKVHPISHVLFPKKNAYDFRRAALVQPLDTITYLALVLQYADVIEKHRIQKSKKRVFSYRFKPNDSYLFDSNYNFTAFQKHTQKKANSRRCKVVVSCDISSFYDRLNLHRLESTLRSLPIEPSQIKLTNELLLFWANRDSYSLPIGSNASRILAEAALISVDDYLMSHQVDFCRFVDDYRFFAKDAQTAHRWLSLLVERLYLEGLTINPSKTKMEDVSGKIKKTPPTPEQKKLADTQKQGRLLVGYTGMIPTKFRKLTEKEIKELSDISLDEQKKKLIENQILQPEHIRTYLKIIVAQQAYTELTFVRTLLDKFPQFAPLVVDLLIKQKENIPDNIREDMTEYFKGLLDSEDCYPEYLLIAAVKLLGSKGYVQKETLMNFFRGLRRNSGTYIGRAVLDAVAPYVNRTEALEIRQYYQRADLWEKRAIVEIVKNTLSEDEKRPWLKNIKTHASEDSFLAIAPPPKTKSSNKKKQQRNANPNKTNQPQPHAA